MMHGMRFNAFHHQLAPSGRHAAAAGLVRAHHYRAHALHSGQDDGIDTLPMHLAAQRFQQERVLAYPLHGLKKLWNRSLECGAAVAMGASDAG